MDITNVSGYTLNNLSKINIILGKNGCGKSVMLRKIDGSITSDSDHFGKSKYITPERGGTLVYSSGIEENITRNNKWMSDERRKNLSSNFRQQTVAQYKKLETLILREFEQDQSKDKFDPYIERINSLLDNIEIRRDEVIFKIFTKGTENEIKSDAISSGESELISLGIECLIFSKEYVEDEENILFLDEPDVHLHPDLQVRLMHFIKNLVTENNFRVIIATHSTAILGALESYSQTHLCFMQSKQTKLEFKAISDVYRRVIPVFGAHPLSNIFNEAPILLVEGEDDERIWQQVVRSSSGRIRLYPCSTESITNMNSFEKESQQILQSIYDNAVGFSLRDRDDDSEEIINDMPPIVRMKLSCSKAENLLLTDEVLGSLGTKWDELINGIDDWLIKNQLHPHYKTMKKFKDDGLSRKDFDIKEIRNDLLGIIGTSKPWEIVVGQAIANLRYTDSINFAEEGKLFTYLGKKTSENLLKTKNN